MTNTLPIIKHYDYRTNKTYCLMVHDETHRELYIKELMGRADWEYNQTLPPEERAKMKKIKLTKEVPRERILALIYASYFLGYEHHANQLLLTHPESVETRRFLNSLVESYEK